MHHPSPSITNCIQIHSLFLSSLQGANNEKGKNNPEGLSSILKDSPGKVFEGTISILTTWMIIIC